MKLSFDDARRYWRDAGIDPTSLSFSGQSIAKAEPTTEELRSLTAALARTKGTDVHQHAQAMLIAALGTTVAHRILDRSQLREKWSRLIDAIQNGSPATKEIGRSDAVRLSRELCSDAAQALRVALAKSFTTPDALDEPIAEARSSGLSYRAISMIIRDLYPHLGRAAQHRIDDLVREARIEEELRELFRSAKGAAHLRDVPVASLVRDEALFLDGFEVFIDANDRALKLITEMSQASADALQDGRDFTVHSGGASLTELSERLASEVGRMVEWFEALGSKDAAAKLRATYDRVMEKLAERAEDLERVFTMGYGQLGGFDFHQDLAANKVPEHVAKPYEAFIGICSKSKPTVDIDSIETVEELIRVLHREVAHAYGQHVKNHVKKGLALRKTHRIEAKSPQGKSWLGLTYVGNCTKETLTGTPMGDVRDALVSYIEHGKNNHQHIENGVITDKTMSFDVTLGCHTGRLNVTYDSRHDLYFVEWGLQEPQDGRGRLEFCPSYFAKAGFEHTIDGWKHYARKKVSREDIHKTIWFMMFSLENMKNVDISSPVFNQSALYRLFESWYHSENRTRGKSADLSHHADEVMKRFPDWGELEKDICRLMLEDPHPFRVAEIDAAASRTSSTSNNLHAFAIFIADHARALLGSDASPERMAAIYQTVAQVYFDAVQPLLFSELKELGLAGSPPKRDSASMAEASRLEAERVRGATDPDEISRRLKEGYHRLEMQGPVYQRTR